MQLQLLNDKFCICKIDSVKQADLQSDFFFIAKTDEEISLVCKEANAPKNCIKIDKTWRGMRIVGTLDFSLVGVLSDISAVLAKAGAPIFAVSTYDTDYILIKQEYLDKALGALQESGYMV